MEVIKKMPIFAASEMKVLATPLNAGSKTLSPLLRFKSHLMRAAFSISHIAF